MKVKNLFITFGLSLALGVVAAVGAGQKAEKVEAARATELYIDASGSHWVTGWSTSLSEIKVKVWIDGTGNDQYPTMSTVSLGGKSYRKFTLPSSNYDGGYVYAYNEDSAQNKSSNFSIPSDGKNLIVVTGGTNNTGPSVSWSTLDVGTTYTVTKYGVYDGVLDDEHPIGSDTVGSGDTYAVPSRENKTGYHFVGWYTTSACTVAYTAKAITENTSVYAKYTSLSKDSYIYYITDSSEATPNMIHTWGGDMEYANKDVTITGITGAAEVHGVTRFRNTDYLIYKIPFSSESGDTSFKFHYNNWQTQSSEKTLVAGNAYQWEDGGIATNEVAGGDALDFILALEAKRNAVTASGSIKAYSVCGISAEDSATLCTTYNELSATARGYVDTSYTYTYKRDDSSKNDNVSFYDIMEQLAKQAGVVALTGHSASRLVPMSSTGSNNAGVIIAIVASFALITVVGCILIKRKHN